MAGGDTAPMSEHTVSGTWRFSFITLGGIEGLVVPGCCYRNRVSEGSLEIGPCPCAEVVEYEA